MMDIFYKVCYNLRKLFILMFKINIKEEYNNEKTVMFIIGFGSVFNLRGL